MSGPALAELGVPGWFSEVRRRLTWDEAGADEAGVDGAEAEEAKSPAEGVRCRLPAAAVDDDAAVRFLLLEDPPLPFCAVILNVEKSVRHNKGCGSEKRAHASGKLKVVEKAGELDARRTGRRTDWSEMRESRSDFKYGRLTLVNQRR